MGISLVAELIRRYPDMNNAASTTSVSCDVCGNVQQEFATLGAAWKAPSIHQGERYELHLCEPCFFATLGHLKRERQVNTMFSNTDEDLTRFGLA